MLEREVGGGVYCRLQARASILRIGVGLGQLDDVVTMPGLRRYCRWGIAHATQNHTEHFRSVILFCGDSIWMQQQFGL